MEAFELVLEFPDGGQQVLPVGSKPITLGRVKGNTLVLTDQTVSRQHAKVFERDGAHFLVDLNSTHGSFVNRRKITRHRLQPGDEIRIGSTTLHFVVAGSSAEPPPAPVAVAAEPAADHVEPPADEGELELEMPEDLLPARGGPAETTESPGPPPATETGSPAPESAPVARSALTPDGEDPFADDEELESERLANFGRSAKQSSGGGRGSLYRSTRGREVESGNVLQHDLAQHGAGFRWLATVAVLAVVVLLGWGTMRLVRSTRSADEPLAHEVDAPAERQWGR